MTPSSQVPEPVTYRIRVAGHLDDHWVTWLHGMVIHRDNGGTTTLTGPVADQAQLHGLLARIRDLGVALISVQIQAAGAQPPFAIAAQTSHIPTPTPNETSAAHRAPEDDRSET